MHTLTFSLTIFTVSCLGLAACGSNVAVDKSGSTGAGAGTTGAGPGTTGAGGGGGGAPVHGDCKTDADCVAGTCAPITPGGYMICLEVPPQATTCSSPEPPQNQCCTSADCKNGGACYSTSDLTYCGGPAMEIYNECLTDQCATDSDCAATSTTPQLCAPAGAFGSPVRSCFVAYCHTDADCTAHAGGYCAPVTGPCCSSPSGLACVYPGGCKQGSDCTSPNDSCHIDPTTGTGECGGPVPCPV